MRKIDLKGQRFGRLVVIEEAGRSQNGGVLWKCRCDCGNETVASSANLLSGRSTSCGCFHRERVTKHGMSRNPLYRVWSDMMKRTGVYRGADDAMRRDYIGRGISVCEEWRSFDNFCEWSSKHGYAKGLQIDRIDNDRGYEPGNCRWVTSKQNTNNRRCTLRLPDGTPLAEYSERCGVPTCSNNRATKQYDRIYRSYVRHGADVAIAQVWGEAISLHFAEYGVLLVPFSKISIIE